MAEVTPITNAPGPYIISIDGVRHHFHDPAEARHTVARLYGRVHAVYLGRRP